MFLPNAEGVFCDGLFAKVYQRFLAVLALLEQFVRISLYMTDDNIAMLYVTSSFVKFRKFRQRAKQ